MKKSFYFFSLAAMTAVALAGCNKSEVNAPETPDTHTVTFKVDAPVTKTELVDNGTYASFKWQENDAKYFVVKENGTSGSDVTLTLSDDGMTATISATFSDSDESATDFTYSAFMSAATTNGGFPKVATAQESDGTTYDPKADILIAEDETFSSVPTEGVSLSFMRPVAINKMTLKGLTDAAGDAVSSIKISSDKAITGYYYNGAWNDQDKAITVTTSQNVSTDGEVSVYFVTQPVSGATLSIEVVTSNYIYTKTLTSTIDFSDSRVTVFGVNNLDKQAVENYAGNWYMTNTDMTKVAQVYSSGDNNILAKDLTEEDGVYYYDPDQTGGDPMLTLVLIDDEDSDYNGMYTIAQGNNYLYSAGTSEGNNYLKTSTTLNANSYWTVTYTTEWSITATKSSNKSTIIRYNSDSKLFSCYASAQDAVMLVSADIVKPTPVINAADIAIAYSAGSGNLDASFNSNTTKVTAVAYDDEACTETSTWLTTNVDGTSLTYTATENTGSERIAYVVITAANDEGRKVSATVAVTQGAYGTVEETVQYSFTISTSDFNSTSYAANNGTHTSTATGVSDETKTMTVEWYSNQVMFQNSVMQWKKSVGYIYNTTNLGTIVSVTVNSTSGSFTTYYGTSQNPTSGTTVGDGYFNVKVGSSAVGKTTSVVVVFEK